MLAKRSLLDIPSILLALATVAVLWTFKKLQEPHVVPAAAVFGLLVYPPMR